MRFLSIWVLFNGSAVVYRKVMLDTNCQTLNLMGESMYMYRLSDG